MDTKFKPGQSGNPNGRPPGSTERVKELRDRISQVVDECFSLASIKDDLRGLKPVERLNLLDKLLRHVLPAVPSENLLDGLSDSDLDKLIIHLKKQLN